MNVIINIFSFEKNEKLFQENPLFQENVIIKLYYMFKMRKNIIQDVSNKRFYNDVLFRYALKICCSLINLK